MFRAAAIVCLLTGLLAVGVAVASSPEKITAKGVGPVQLGATYSALHHQHLIGTIGKGCELAGPNARSAALNAPLKGSVDFTQSSPRKVTDISVRKGAKARGVGIGNTIADIKQAFPKAKVDHSTDKTFGMTLVKIPKNGGGRLQFGVDVKTKKVVLIGIPFIAICD